MGAVSAARGNGFAVLLSLLGRSNSRCILKLTQLGNYDFEKLSNFIAFRAVVLPTCYLSDLAPATFSPRGVPPTPIAPYPEAFAIKEHIGYSLDPPSRDLHVKEPGPPGAPPEAKR